jgi:hypothetical protein
VKRALIRSDRKADLISTRCSINKTVIRQKETDWTAKKGLPRTLIRERWLIVQVEERFAGGPSPINESQSDEENGNPSTAGQQLLSDQRALQ